MKKIEILFLKCIVCFSLLLLMSCRDTSGQKNGTATGQEANSNTRGTDSPTDNEGSGSGTKETPSEANNDKK